MNGLYASILTVLLAFNGGLCDTAAEKQADDNTACNVAGECFYENGGICSYIDNDGDGICDNHADKLCRNGNNGNYIDNDNDGVCDNYENKSCPRTHGQGRGRGCHR